MSLKAFHIFFIIISIVLTVGFGFWGVRDYSNSKNVINFILGISSFVGGGALAIYLVWFFSKMKRISHS